MLDVSSSGKYHIINQHIKYVNAENTLLLSSKALCNSSSTFNINKFFVFGLETFYFILGLSQVVQDKESALPR